MNRNDRKPVVRALAVALAAGCIGAVTAAETDVRPSAEFRRLDVNRDGTLSREETRKLRDFDRAFDEADDNRDGRLDAGEFVKAQSVYERIRARHYVDDSVVTAKVKAALLRDPLVKAFSVSVETFRGTVLLSGFVDNEVQQRRAAELAAGVEGVVTVKNGLVVKG